MPRRKSTDTVQLKLRFDEKLRRRLAGEADKADRSLNGEIIHRLERSFQALDDMLGGPHTAALLQILAGEIKLMEAKLGDKWTKDEATAMAVGQAIARVLSPTMPDLQTIEFSFKDGRRVINYRTEEATKS